MKQDLFLMTTLGVILLRGSFGKPTEIVVNSDTLDPVALAVNNSTKIDITREQRSPQFGLLNDYGDYSDYDDVSRHFHLGHKRKFHKHKPFGFGGTHGCRGYGCGGWRPGYGEYYNGHHPVGQGGSFASASAGSVGGGGGPYGGHSQANAQSASFSFGPYTASFSVAQSSSGRKAF